MTLNDLKEDLLRKLWLENPANAPAYILPDVASAINRAYQLLWSSKDDFFRRETATVATTIGAPTIALPAAVQEVLGPVRISGGLPLVPLRDEGDYNMASSLYPDASGTGTPRYYYTRRTRAATADNVTIVLALLPVPDAVASILIDVANEAPAFTVAQFTAAPSTVLPIPHNYAELYLQPIARKCVTTSHFFWDKDKQAQIDNDYQEALAALGIADPFRSHEPADRKEEATA